MPISLLLAHQTTFVRQGLRRLLEEDEQIRVVADYDNGLAAVNGVAQYTPRLVVLDADLPQLSALDTSRLIRRRYAQTGIVVLSVPADLAVITRYLQVGVTGFLRSDFTSKNLVQAIKQVADNQVYLSPNLADLTQLKETKPDQAPVPRHPPMQTLTDRQKEILSLLADGFSTKEIAEGLSISPKTVDAHRKDLMAKLRIYSVAELTKYAILEGLTTLGV